MEVYLELSRAPRTKIFMVLAIVWLARGQGIGHEAVQVYDVVQGIELVVFFRAAKEVATAGAPDHRGTAINGNF